jgi:hypothetical protein
MLQNNNKFLNIRQEMIEGFSVLLGQLVQLALKIVYWTTLGLEQIRNIIFDWW